MKQENKNDEISKNIIKKPSNLIKLIVRIITLKVVQSSCWQSGPDCSLSRYGMKVLHRQEGFRGHQILLQNPENHQH
jgi:hypothetical protein